MVEQTRHHRRMPGKKRKKHKQQSMKRRPLGLDARQRRQPKSRKQGRRGRPGAGQGTEKGGRPEEEDRKGGEQRREEGRAREAAWAAGPEVCAYDRGGRHSWEGRR